MNIFFLKELFLQDESSIPESVTANSIISFLNIQLQMVIFGISTVFTSESVSIVGEFRVLCSIHCSNSASFPTFNNIMGKRMILVPDVNTMFTKMTPRYTCLHDKEFNPMI